MTFTSVFYAYVDFVSLYVNFQNLTGYCIDLLLDYLAMQESYLVVSVYFGTRQFG